MCGRMYDIWRRQISKTTEKRTVLVRVLLRRRHSRTTATLVKEGISLGLAYRFRGLDRCHHGRKYGGTQANMMQER